MPIVQRAIDLHQVAQDAIRVHPNAKPHIFEINPCELLRSFNPGLVWGPRQAVSQLGVTVINPGVI